MRYQQIRDAFRAFLVGKLGTLDEILRRLEGGWEGWLQVELALVLLGQGARAASHRERQYPGDARRVDLFVQPAAGTGIWIELKTQRKDLDKSLPQRVAEDIVKIRTLGTRFMQTDVVIAFGVTFVTTDDELAAIRANAMTSGFGVAQWDGSEWKNVTDRVTMDTLTVLEWNPQAHGTPLRARDAEVPVAAATGYGR